MINNEARTFSIIKTSKNCNYTVKIIANFMVRVKRKSGGGITQPNKVTIFSFIYWDGVLETNLVKC